MLSSGNGWGFEDEYCLAYASSIGLCSVFSSPPMSKKHSDVLHISLVGLSSHNQKDLSHPITNGDVTHCCEVSVYVWRKYYMV